MVSPETPPPSSASSLTLIGGELALDFANTSSGRGGPMHKEHLRRPEDVVDWAARARVLAPADAAWLRAAATAEPPLGERLMRSALELREHIFVLGAEIAAGRPAPAPRIESLAHAHAEYLASARLVPFEGRFVWSWATRSAPVEAVLGPISLSALTTLLQADLTRVKQCQGEKCGWLFFDTTKNKSRRWCEMEICGNRAKQRRFGERARRP